MPRSGDVVDGDLQGPNVAGDVVVPRRPRIMTLPEFAECVEYPIEAREQFAELWVDDIQRYPTKRNARRDLLEFVGGAVEEDRAFGSGAMRAWGGVAGHGQ